MSGRQVAPAPVMMAAISARDHAAMFAAGWQTVLLAERSGRGRRRGARCGLGEARRDVALRDAQTLDADCWPRRAAAASGRRLPGGWPCDVSHEARRPLVLSRCATPLAPR